MKAAIISDIHANKYAFDLVMADIRKQKCDYLLVLGDLVGYYYWPSEIVRSLIERPNTFVIRGNHEDLLALACECKNERDAYQKKYGMGINRCIDTLTEHQLDWLLGLPSQMEIELNGIRVGLYHGSDISTNEYIYPDTELARLTKMAGDLDFKFYGHTHYPMVAMSGGTVLANPGSVGQPRDVGALASYMVLNLSNRVLSPRRVPFDPLLVCDAAKETDPHLPYLSDIMRRNNSFC